MSAEQINTEEYKGVERRSKFDYTHCPLYKIHDKDVELLSERLQNLNKLSDLQDNQLQDTFMQRFNHLEKKTDDRFEQLDTKIDTLAEKVEKLETTLCTRIGEIINNLFGKIMKWLFIAVVGGGIIYALRPWVANLIHLIIGV